MAFRTCPACGSTELVENSQGSLECGACGMQLPDGLVQCPSCGNINPEGSARCDRCGEPLEIFAQVISRHVSPGSATWLQQVRSQASEIKGREAEASEVRFQALQDVDRRRQMAEAEAADRQRRKDRQTLIIGIIAFGTILVFALVVGAVTLIP